MKNKHLDYLLIIDQIVESIQPTKIKSSDLFSGNAGALLLFAYLHKYTEMDIGDKLQASFLEIEKHLSKPQAINPSFSGGISGIGWTLQHLAEMDIIDQDKGMMQVIDQFAIKGFNRFCKDNEFDNWHGFIGIANYLMQRHKTVDMSEHLTKLPNAIWDASHLYKNQKVWGHNGKRNVFLNEEKNINFGLAHGLSGILFAVSKLYDLGIEKEECEKLMLHLGELILRFKNKEKNSLYSLYPSKLPLSQIGAEEQYNVRLVLCYGDMTIASTFYKAGKSLKKQAWMDEALSIMDVAVMRRNAEEKMEEVCICHGTISAAHLFHKFYNETKKETYKNAAEYWLNETKNMHNKRTTKGSGFLYKCIDPDNKQEGLIWASQSGFLDGDIGVALSLLYVLDIAPSNWDSLLAIDI